MKDSHIAQLDMTRRRFISRALATLTAALSLGRGGRLFAKDEKPLSPRKKRIVTTACDLAVARGDSPAALTRRAVAELGGIGLFVRRGDVVVIKPNIGWDRAPQYAANTNPEVVATLVKMCREAGAREVRVFDRTCNSAPLCYRSSGIESSARGAGGTVYHVSDWKFLPAAFPADSAMAESTVYRDAVECDCFINVPVAKHHSLAGLTLSMKNLMGVCGGNRGTMHWNLDKKLAELTAFIAPDLTVIDAFRILTKHGPSGGNLADVKNPKTVIAGTDPVLIDAFAASLFDIDPRSIAHIKKAEEMKVGTANVAGARVRRVTI